MAVIDNLQDRVITLIAQQHNIDKENIDMDSSFKKDIGADSMDQVELVLTIEDEFSISIPDEESANITTVGQAVAKIEEKLKEKDS